jgi:hypothetical protein
MVTDGRALYAAVSDVVRLPAPEGSKTDASHPAGPIGNAALDPNKGGGLTALDLASGKKLWFAPSVPCAPPRAGCSPGQPGALTVIPGQSFPARWTDTSAPLPPMCCSPLDRTSKAIYFLASFLGRCGFFCAAGKGVPTVTIRSCGRNSISAWNQWRASRPSGRPSPSQISYARLRICSARLSKLITHLLQLT